MTPRLEAFLLRIADTNLVVAQRLGELIGHAPEIEQDISLANIGLDHIERARAYYQHLADIRRDGSTEDTFAFERTPESFRNLCLAELPNTDYAHLMLRQYLLDTWHLKLFPRLAESTHSLLSKYWASWLDQTRYHHRYSSAWVKRLGEGTEESHRRMQAALNVIWPFGQEIVESDAVEQEMQTEGIAHVDGLGEEWLQETTHELQAAGLKLPHPDSDITIPMGKQGLHTPHLSELLEELQFMHRLYPKLSW